MVDTAEDAINAARHGRYAVLILDLNHTDTGTTAILRSLREQGCLVPVLVLNGRDSPRDRATALDAGAADFLRMPFRFADLVLAIGHHITTGRGRVPLEDPGGAARRHPQRAGSRMSHDPFALIDHSCDRSPIVAGIGPGDRCCRRRAATGGHRRSSAT